jgi:gamma-glutamyltranspeptidase/glutathione hydrolase
MQRGVVAAGHPETARAAEEVLRAGGNAFDAVIAAHCAACVAEPVLASVGGGGFLLAREHGGGTRVYDFFAQTPGRTRPDDELDFHPIVADFGTTTQEFHIGLGSIAVPGSVRGMFTIHRDLGSMPMRELMTPAIELARSGVELNALQAYIFSVVAPIYLATPEAKAIFAPGGELLTTGESYINAELADFLEVLAVEGEDLFYRGEIAQTIERQCRSGGGLLSAADLEAYRVLRREPLRIDYRNARLWTNPPPSSGGILIAFALRLLDDTRVSELEFGSAGHLALLARVMALTNQARIEAHLDQSTAEFRSEQLLDPALLARYRAAIAGRPTSRRGTTHISVLDGRGNAAAMTVSNGEGCGYIVPDTGMMLNNMLGEEDLNPHGFHRWQPDRRISSMMSPSLIECEDGRRVVLGSGGSNRIRTALLQVLINLIDFRMDIEPAVVAPRVHFENDLLNVEGGLDQDQLGELLRGHPEHKLWDGLNLFFGGTHLAAFDGDRFQGVGDPRRGGVAGVV